MSNAITDGFNITCNGVTKNSLTDYGWALENRFDCIGDPVKQSSVVSVPFGKTYDLANALNGGEPYFVSRPITLKIGVKKPSTNWRDYISDLRNTYEGREVEIKFDGESFLTSQWSWSGTAYIQEVESTRQDCRFDLFIDADAYKRGKNVKLISQPNIVFPLLEGTSEVEVYAGAPSNFTISWTNNGVAKSYSVTGAISWTVVPDLIAGYSENVTVSGSGTLARYRYKARSL